MSARPSPRARTRCRGKHPPIPASRKSFTKPTRPRWMYRSIREPRAGMTSTPTDNPTRARALALAGAGIATAFAVPAIGQTLLPIRIGTSLSDPFLEPFYAQEKGFFKDAGLTADVQSLFNGSAELAAIQGGSLDIGNTDLIVLANAFNRGVDVGVVASGAAYNADMPT